MGQDHILGPGGPLRAMLDAGERYEEDRCIVWGSPSGRDSLDQSPRGGASAPASEGLARAQARLYAAEVAVSAALSGDPRRGAMTAPRALELLRGVCHEHARLPPPRSWERGLLNAALRALVAHYGLEG